MPNLPVGISSMKLKVSTFEQEISSASLGNNSIQINEEIKNAFNNQPSGTIFTPSIAVTYSDTGSEILTPTAIPNYVPKPPQPTWTQRGADIDGEAAFDQSGYSVSISADGSVVAIGAIGNYNGNYSGHVRVYEYNATSWVQRGADIDGEAVYDQSGRSVSLSVDGSIVAIGAAFNDGNGNYSGHVRVYEYNATSWVQRGADIDGEADENQSGISVSISADGSVVAIGATSNANYRGHVRVYEWINSIWVQRGADIDGEAAYDQSGYSVSLSADGSIVAIGAPYNDGNGGNSGHVRVYKYE